MFAQACRHSEQSALQRSTVPQATHLLPRRSQWALKERGVPAQLRDRIVDYVQVSWLHGGPSSVRLPRSLRPPSLVPHAHCITTLPCPALL